MNKNEFSIIQLSYGKIIGSYRTFYSNIYNIISK